MLVSYGRDELAGRLEARSTVIKADRGDAQRAGKAHCFTCVSNTKSSQLCGMGMLTWQSVCRVGGRDTCGSWEKPASADTGPASLTDRLIHRPPAGADRAAGVCVLAGMDPLRCPSLSLPHAETTTFYLSYLAC